MNAQGTVFKYPDNVDTDVIIPARYLNSQDAAELARHCMEDIDPDFVNKVKPGDIMVGGKLLGILRVQVAGRDDDIGIHIIRVFENRTVCVVHG